jgi:hypothetical protein
MPLVFVHGVNVRVSAGYEKENKTRDALFRQFALRAVKADPARAAILSPYWGDLGVRFYWGHASLPGRGAESFGPVDDFPGLLTREALGDQTPDPEAALLQVARKSLPEAVDLLWAIGAEAVTDDRRAANLAELAARASDYLKSRPDLGWLDEVKDDAQFVDELASRVEAWSSAETGMVAFGLEDFWQDIREAGGRITASAGAVASRAVIDLVRPSLNEGVSRFLGDAFTYLDKRGTREAPGPIVQRLLSDLARAGQAVAPHDPRLIVVAHSMGGNVMYDILSHFLPHAHPDLVVDAFVTVGSQVGVFEEMKLFRERDLNMPADPLTDRAPCPANVRFWLNVFDENDVFAFAAEKIFDGVSDYSYVTGQGLIMAHTSYFSLPSFHRRLADRLAALLA